MIPIDRPGNVRGQAISIGLREENSGAVGLAIKAHVWEFWNADTQEWEDWRPHNVEVDGVVWLVKKANGGINENGFKSVCAYMGWDGDFEKIPTGEFKPTPCQFQIGSDEYKGQTRYRIEFVNDFNSTPGNTANVDLNKAKQLSARYGSMARAIAGNVQRNGSLPPTGLPPKPPMAPPIAPPPQPQPSAFSGHTDGEDIPF